MDTTYAVELSDDGGGVRLCVSGEVDMAAAPRLLDAILRAAFTYDQDQLVVDVSGVSFMDSTGLGALREAHRHLVADGTRLSVRNPDPVVEKLLHITGLDTYLNIERDDSERPTPPVFRRVG